MSGGATHPPTTSRMRTHVRAAAGRISSPHLCEFDLLTALRVFVPKGKEWPDDQLAKKGQ